MLKYAHNRNHTFTQSHIYTKYLAIDCVVRCACIRTQKGSLFLFHLISAAWTLMHVQKAFQVSVVAKTFHKNEHPTAKATLKKSKKKERHEKSEHTTKHPHQVRSKALFYTSKSFSMILQDSPNIYRASTKCALCVVCLYSANADFKHKKTIMPIYLNKYVRKCIHSRMFPTIWSVRHCHFNMSAFLFCGLFFIRCVAFGTFIWLVFASMIVQCCCVFFLLLLLLLLPLFALWPNI